MAIPRLYLLHPPESRLPGVTEWLADAESRVKQSADWDGCQLRSFVYDMAGAFNVATASDVVRRATGPVVLLEKVQQRIRSQFEAVIGRQAVVLCVPVWSADELWSHLESARCAFESGHPLVPLRELIAYLIVKKLATLDKWGGTATNKAFLWSEDLPKGGFPHDLCDKRQILDVAHFLVSVGVLRTKTSQGQTKYALGEKPVVAPILDCRSLATVASARKFLEREPTRVSARLLFDNS